MHAQVTSGALALIALLILSAAGCAPYQTGEPGKTSYGPVPADTRTGSQGGNGGGGGGY
jgi:hypothetical protein